MAEVKALNTKKRGKVEIVFKEGSPLTLEEDVAVKEGLRVGKVFDEDYLKDLKVKNAMQKCYNAAIRLLSFRPRSKSEIEIRLTKKGYSKEIIDKAIRELEGQKLINDEDFARFWKENRCDFNPRSSQMLKQELRQKGVSAEAAEEAVSEINDEEMAFKAALPKAARLALLEQEQFKKKIQAFLIQRGFSYRIIKETSSRLWQEINKENSSG